MMEYLVRYDIYVPIIIGSVVVIPILYIMLAGIPELMTKGRCKYTEKGFKTKSSCGHLPFYYFSIFSAIIESGFMILNKDSAHYHLAIIWIECIGIIVCLIWGYILVRCKGLVYEVKGECLYICGREKMTISIPKLKKSAQKNFPQYEKGNVRFNYMDDYFVIPVNKCVGGYDFVNMLCDKMDLPRIYMEDIRL